MQFATMPPTVESYEKLPNPPLLPTSRFALLTCLRQNAAFGGQ
jgi:hypothetical protein